MTPVCVEGAFVDAPLVQVAAEPAARLRRDADRLEAEAASPGEALRALVTLQAEAGLSKLLLEGSAGGAFASVLSRALCLAREHLGYGSPLSDLAFAMQGLGSYPITFRGDASQKGAWLPHILRGSAVAAFALTEPEAGSDLDGLSARARRDGADYVLDGHKCFISNAGVANFYTLFAVTAPEAARHRLSAFIVPADTRGLETRATRILGDHPIGEVILREARVPVSTRIGEEGEGLAIALATLARFRPTVGAAAVGFAQRAFDEARAHVRSRIQFRAPLADLPAVQGALAEMACEVDAARLLVYRSALATDAAAEAGIDPASARGELALKGSMAKLVATESAQRVIDRAVQLLGARGLTYQTIVTRLYEDVRALRIYEGASDVQKILIARELLKQRR